MSSDIQPDSARSDRQGISLPRVLLIVLVTVLVTLGGSYWVLKTYVFAREFKPVELSAKEERVLDSKLRVLGYQPERGSVDNTAPSADEFD
ncbi:MAG: hypothetical protein PVH86_09075, partial [Thiogranum sp.]